MRGSYVELKVGRNPETFWNPIGREIFLAASYIPLDLSHEIAHVELEHDTSGSSLVDMVQEKDAWMVALRRIDPSEIVICEIQHDLRSYLSEVASEFGRHSPQHILAVRLVGKVVAYARERKKEVS